MSHAHDVLSEKSGGFERKSIEHGTKSVIRTTV